MEEKEKEEEEEESLYLQNVYLCPGTTKILPTCVIKINLLGLPKCSV